MQTKPLYKYTRADGGVTVSPTKPDVEYTQMYRLIADEESEITNGQITTTCIDVESPEGWNDADADEITDTEALQIITGGAT